MHVFRWDLDRTYLDTEIHSMRGLLRTALERAGDKRNVPGAAALLRGLVTHDPSCRVVVLSGSPTQMRDVLQEKLNLDGVRVDKLILKDNLGNLRRGRLRAVRDQIGYKLPALLRERVDSRGAGETLFGDDSEADALVYVAFAQVLSGELDERGIVALLKATSAYSDNIAQAREAARQLAGGDGAVEDIFIRVDRGVPVAHYRLLGGRVMAVFSWLQAALTLFERGRLGAPELLSVARSCTQESSLAPEHVAGLFQDAVRRGLVSADVAMGAAEAPGFEAVALAIRRALEMLPPQQRPGPTRRPDLLGFLKAVQDAR